MWLKATPRFLAHEAEVLEHLQPTGLVPRLIASRPGRVVMHDVDGRDGYGIGGEAMSAAVDVLLELQEAVDVDALHGVPQLNAATLAPQLDRLAERWSSSLDGDDVARLQALRDEITDRFEAVAGCGQTLVHGDFHGGNLRLRPAGPPVVLDWGDSAIGCPLVDVFALDSYQVDGADAVRARWLDRLSASAEQWTAFRPVAALLAPLTYQRFCDHIEATELIYHQDDILPALKTALQSV